jgi:antitoxin YefM
MLTINYSSFRHDLKAFLDKVSLSHSPLIITRSKGEDVVVMSKADYDSMEETFYLLKSPKNAERLLRSIAQFEEGKYTEQQLIEE